MDGLRMYLGERPLSVSVGARRVLTLSVGLMEALGSPQAVVFWSDPKKGTAALTAAPLGAQGAHPVRVYEHYRGTGLVSAGKFCRSLGLGAGRKFPVTVENGRAVFDYRSGASVVVAGNGAAKKEEGPDGQEQA